jgi:hypothetical protein
MGRTKGTINKEIQLPEVYTLTPQQRLQVIADLLIEMICEEEACGQQ